MEWLIILALFGGLAYWVWRKRQTVQESATGDSFTLERLRQKRYELLEAIAYVDNYEALLPPGESAEEVRKRRQAAYNRYEEAVQHLESARNRRELERVQMLFDEADYDIGRAKALIDQLTGGTGVVVDPREVVETETPPRDAQCYFCHQVPFARVAATVEGKRQSVWVCKGCLQSIRDGRLPG